MVGVVTSVNLAVYHVANQLVIAVAKQLLLVAGL